MASESVYETTTIACRTGEWSVAGASTGPADTQTGGPMFACANMANVRADIARLTGGSMFACANMANVRADIARLCPVTHQQRAGDYDKSQYYENLFHVFSFPS